MNLTPMTKNLYINLILWIISATAFFVMKHYEIMGRGIVLAMGLSAVVIISCNYFYNIKPKLFSDYAFWITMLLISTLLFTFIQHRKFIEISYGTLFWVALVFTIRFILEKVKSNSSDAETT